MRVKTIKTEWFQDYKKPSMFIGTISCGGKCCIENGLPLSVCQNDGWRGSAPINIQDDLIAEMYLKDHITQAVVFGGLEPMEQFDELMELIKVLRANFGCHDDIVIYTGYNRDEIEKQVVQLQKFDNIIVKFGRYIPKRASRFDEVLGVTLSSDNQYAERIS